MRTMSQQHTQHRRTRLTRRAFAAASALALAGAVAAAAGAPALAAVDPASVDDGLWYYTRTGVAEAHQQTTGQGITIAVVEGVINPAAQDLAGANLQVVSACPSDDGTLLPATAADASAEHATQVVSMLIGTGSGVDGRRGVQGVAPGATVRHYTISPPGWEELTDTPQCAPNDGGRRGVDVAAAIDQAVADGARILSISSSALWGPEEVDAFLRAYSAGVVVVAAAPNAMSPGAQLKDPADLNGVVVVGGHDIDGAVPANMPPNSPYLTVVAPGTALRGPVVVDGSWDRYALVDGTSLATPWTAGVLALAWSLHPDATANQMIQALIHTTTTTAEGGEPVHDDQYGYGPVSVPRLMAVDPTTFPDENPLLHPLDDDQARPTTTAILEATGKTVPEETPEPTPEPTTPPTDTADDQADNANDESSALPLPAILGGAALLLAAAITTAVLLRRRTTTTAAATSTSTTGEGA